MYTSGFISPSLLEDFNGSSDSEEKRKEKHSHWDDKMTTEIVTDSKQVNTFFTRSCTYLNADVMRAGTHCDAIQHGNFLRWLASCRCYQRDSWRTDLPVESRRSTTNGFPPVWDQYTASRCHHSSAPEKRSLCCRWVVCCFSVHSEGYRILEIYWDTDYSNHVQISEGQLDRFPVKN